MLGPAKFVHYNQELRKIRCIATQPTGTHNCVCYRRDFAITEFDCICEYYTSETALMRTRRQIFPIQVECIEKFKLETWVKKV